MAFIAVVFGVATAVTGWTASDSVAAQLAAQPVRGGVAVVAQAQPGTTLTSADLAAVRDVAGARSAYATTVSYAGLVGPHGKLVASDTPPSQAGTEFARSAADHRFILTGGRAPQQPGEIAIGVDAVRAGVHVGDTVRVLRVGGRTQTEHVVGTYDYAALGPATGTFAGPAPGGRVRPAGRAGFRHCTHRGRQRLRDQGPGPPHRCPTPRRCSCDLTTGRRLASANQAAAASGAADIRATILPFAAVTLLVGAFVIGNTFLLLITQRRRSYAMLRAIGAHRGQVVRSVLLEGVVVGLLGGAVGTGVGIAISPLLLTVIQHDQADVTVTPFAVCLGLVIGVAVTCAGALGATRRAATVSPMAALRQDEPIRRTRSISAQTLIAAGLLAFGVVGVLLTSRPDADNLTRIAALLFALAGAVGILLVTRPVAALCFGSLDRLLARRVGPATRLAQRNVARDSARTARTATALSVGLALICAMGTFSSTFAHLIASTIRATTPAGTTILQPAAGGEATLNPSDLATASRTPGVTQVAASRDRLSPIGSAHGSTVLRVTAIEPAALHTVLTPPMIAGTDDIRHGVVVSKNQADMFGLRLGSRLTLHPDGATIRTRVVGLYDATELSASLYYDVTRAPATVRSEISTIYASGPNPGAARAALGQRFADRPDVSITDRDGLVAQDVAEQRFAFTLIYAMFALAVAIALFGVVNTLILSVSQRGRELAVLRALGAPRRLVHRMIRMESVLTALLGTLVGIVIGIAAGAVMQHAMLGQRLTDASIPTGVILASLVGMIAAAALAASWPARRAADADILDGLSQS